MLEALLQFDYQLMEWLNHDWQHPWLDVIMPHWRDKKTWVPLYVLLAGLAVYRFRWRGLYFILAAVLTVGVADTLSSKVMKPTFERVRPCNNETLPIAVVQRGGCGGGYSFTSSHATNHFAVAVFIALTLGGVYRWMRWPLLLWAGSIAYGQVYVGVHFPLDVLAGALLGSLIGYGLAKAYLSQPRLQLIKHV